MSVCSTVLIRIADNSRFLFEYFRCGIALRATFTKLPLTACIIKTKFYYTYISTLRASHHLFTNEAG